MFICFVFLLVLLTKIKLIIGPNTTNRELDKRRKKKSKLIDCGLRKSKNKNREEAYGENYSPEMLEDDEMVLAENHIEYQIAKVNAIQ